ncbi:sensor histidine kinase [Paenibacillus sp. HJGM_3]|uniref:cache domain-containing sensor histidine kinase n=1 Tax=Paenibacillus sp. HJGM_3 TaxID=3379816 RepID=UPI00385E9BC1
MRKVLGMFAPTSLKNRLFLAFILVILLPYSFLQYHNIGKIESSIEQQIIVQNTEQLNQLKFTFEELRSAIFRIAIRLEKDPAITALLANAPATEQAADENRRMMDALWVDIQSKSLTSPYVYYSLTDRRDVQYASYTPAPARSLSYEASLNQQGLDELKNGKVSLLWVSDQESDLRPEDSKNPRLVTLYSLLRDGQGRDIGLLRISIDFQAWLSSMARSFPITQDFYLLGENNDIIGGTGVASTSALTDFVLAESGQSSPSHRIEGNYLYNRMPLPAMQWTLVSRFPLQLFFGNIDQMKQQMVTTFLLFTLVFVVITFFILSKITRPLRLLQKKMSEITDNVFLTLLPTNKYKGEVLALAKAFNKMVHDLQALMRRLKEEERQKEAVRFQMLLSQMNPHFLLNTLNVVKWNVMSKGDHETANICMALGKLLETSLNEEADLIHLRQERELTEAYVSILSFRYEKSFEIRWEIDESIDYALVPKLSLQPLVENAIFHGMSLKEREGVIWIRAYADQGRCRLEVEDNGSGWKTETMANAGRKRKSIGLKNIRERLELLFKKEGRLEIEPLPTGTRVQLVFPLLISAPYSEGGTDDVERIARGG